MAFMDTTRAAMVARMLQSFTVWSTDDRKQWMTIVKSTCKEDPTALIGGTLLILHGVQQGQYCTCIEKGSFCQDYLLQMIPWLAAGQNKLVAVDLPNIALHSARLWTHSISIVSTFCCHFPPAFYGPMLVNHNMSL